MIETGIRERNIHVAIDAWGDAGVAPRKVWRLVAAKLRHGDVLMVVALGDGPRTLWARSTTW